MKYLRGTVPRGLRARRPKLMYQYKEIAESLPGMLAEHFKTIAESLTGMLAEHFKQVDEHFALARAVAEGL